MRETEWSRSRFWLGHFLYSRHDRHPITWKHDPPPHVGLREPLRAWLRGRSQDFDETGRWLVERALGEHAGDPAYIQSLRLVVKERQHHRDLCSRLIGTLGAAATARPRPARRSALQTMGRLRRHLLGPRFEMSVRLLRNLVDLAIIDRVGQACDTPAVQGVCENVRCEKRAHVAFDTERLTILYADFNFLRRNLRRLRLRLMCGAFIAAAMWRHGRLIQATGAEQWRFTGRTYAQFSRLLERMVPYRREALLTALLNQRQDPYAEPWQVLR